MYGTHTHIHAGMLENFVGKLDASSFWLSNIWCFFSSSDLDHHHVRHIYIYMALYKIAFNFRSPWKCHNSKHCLHRSSSDAPYGNLTFSMTIYIITLPPSILFSKIKLN
ncbi:hypothetical protein ACOSP7_026165 [Xanthoceras sorbifolium]